MASNAFERQPAHLHFLPLHSSFSPLWPGCRVKHNTQIALPESAVPPDSWTQRAHFCLYLLFLSVALKVINQLLKPSSSLGLVRSFSPWSPVSLVVPFRLGLWSFSSSCSFHGFLFSSHSFHHFRAMSSNYVASISVLGLWLAPYHF